MNQKAANRGRGPSQRARLLGITGALGLAALLGLRAGSLSLAVGFAAHGLALVHWFTSAAARRYPLYPPTLVLGWVTLTLIRPALQALQGNFAISFLPTLPAHEAKELTTIAVLLTGVGSLIFYFGFEWGRRPGRQGASAPLTAWQVDPRAEGAAYSIATVIIIISSIALAAFVRLAGGLDTVLILSNRHEVAQGLQYLKGIALWIQVVPVIFMAAWSARPTRKRQWISSGMIILAVAVSFIFGSRGTVAVGLLVGVIGFHYFLRPIKPRHIVALALAGLVLSNVLLEVRLSTSGNEATPFDTFEQSPFETVEAFADNRRTIDAFASAIYLVPSELPYQYGKTYLGIFAAPVPRALWPDKPVIDESGILGRLLFPDDPKGLPPGTAGVLYMNAGALGVALGMVAFGFMHGRLTRRLLGDPATAGTVIIYAVVVPNLLVITVPAMIQTLLFLPPAAAAAYAVRPHVRRKFVAPRTVNLT